jgi:nucleotide-binding universal stress UspA family protein
VFDKKFTKKPELKILIPSDLNSNQLAITFLLKQLKSKFKTEATVLHVIDSFLQDLPLPYPLESNINQLMYDKTSKLPKLSKPYNVLIEKGHISEKIVAVAKKTKTNLILTEERGKYFHKNHIGNVRQKIVRYSKKSVWVCKSNKLSKVLCCVDGSRSSAKALNNAIQLCKAFNCHLTILYVLPKIDFNPFGLDQHIVVQLNTGFKKKWTSYMDKFLAKFNYQGLKKVEHMYKKGKAAETILDTAEENKYDLIVIGRQGHSILHEIFIGSTVEQVMLFSPCSVLIIH